MKTVINVLIHTTEAVSQISLKASQKASPSRCFKITLAVESIRYQLLISLAPHCVQKHYIMGVLLSCTLL